MTRCLRIANKLNSLFYVAIGVCVAGFFLTVVSYLTACLIAGRRLIDDPDRYMTWYWLIAAIPLLVIGLVSQTIRLSVLCRYSLLKATKARIFRMLLLFIYMIVLSSGGYLFILYISRSLGLAGPKR